MELGCCIGMEYYDTVAAAGYRSIALSGVELTNMDESVFQSGKKKILSGPLAVHSINNFCPPALRLTGSGFDANKLADYSNLLFRRASDIGAQYIGIGSPVSRSTRAGESPLTAIEELERSLNILCCLAKNYGLTILLESVCSLECNLVTYTHEAAQLVRKMSLDNLGLVYDIYHAQMMKEDPEYILEIPDLIHVVHIAQNHNGKRIYLREKNLPEYVPYFKALNKIGYRQECNLECFASNVEEELPRSKKILDRILGDLR